MKPKYIAIAAITIDGKIARHARHMSDWTSKEDKNLLHEELNKGDVIIVGNNTYKTAKKPLSKRNCIVLTGKVKDTKKTSNLLLYCNPKNVNLKKLIETLGYKRINILGGAKTYNFCLKNNLLDELYLTIEPFVFGEGISMFGEKQENRRFILISAKKLNTEGTVLLHYRKK